LKSLSLESLTAETYMPLQWAQKVRIHGVIQ